MIEGQTRGDISRAKQMLRDEPALLRDLLERIARATTSYLKSQIAAGASAIQLFDTWAGELTPAEYDAFELPATQMIFSALGSDVPKILFAKGSARHLDSLAKTGATVLSVDCNTDLAEARRKLGPHIALQGNVDPSALLGDQASIRWRRAGGHRENGRPRPHPESRPRNLANHAGRKRPKRSSRQEKLGSIQRIRSPLLQGIF